MYYVGRSRAQVRQRVCVGLLAGGGRGAVPRARPIPTVVLPVAYPDASRCESIQFVVSMIFSEDGSELLLGYGVNDCDARVQRVPLALALELAQRGSVLEGRPAHGTLRERRSALELENCTRLGR